MAVLDFKEIPKAHIADGMQDTFELFARDFLNFMGYEILSPPDRGADGGKDLIVAERRSGIGGYSIVKWLVSCKHKAHSNNSVTPTDESNISDRVQANDCDGFMGFYSTLPSAGLTTILEGLKSRNNTEFLIYDREWIEGRLLISADGLELARRFFPDSFKKWERESPKPALIFDGEPSLKCHVCETELLEEGKHGIIVSWEGVNEDYSRAKNIEYIRWICKGRCDDVMRNRIRNINVNLIDRWEDIPDVAIPVKYIEWVMVIFNELHGGVEYSDEAFKNIKEFMMNIFPYISRHLTSVEKERMKELAMLEPWF